MKQAAFAVTIAGAMALSACGQSPQAAKVRNDYDDQADAIDNMADRVEQAGDNMTGAAAAANENAVDRLENKADALRNEGNARAEAVDKAVKSTPQR